MTPARLLRADRALTAIFFAMGMGAMTVTSRFAEIKVAIGSNDQLFGFVLTVGSLGGMAGTILAPRLARWLGTDRMVYIFGSIMIVSSAYYGFARSIYDMTLGVLGGSIGYATMNIAINAQSVEVERHAGRPILPRLHALWSAGAFTGVALGSLAAGRISTQWHLGLNGLVALAILWVAKSALLPPDLHLEADVPETPGPIPAAMKPALWLISIGLGCSLIADAGNADWSAIHLHEELGAPLGVNSLGMTAFMLSQIAGRLLSGRLLVRHGTVRVLRTFASVAVLGYGSSLILAHALVPNTTPAVGVMLAGIACLGFGIGPIAPAFFGAAGKLPGLAAARGIAFVGMFLYVVTLLTKPVIATIAEYQGVGVALFTTAVICCGAVYSVRVLRTEKE